MNEKTDNYLRTMMSKLTAGRRFETAVPDDVMTTAGF